MNILVFLQQSTYSNDNKWTTADSNIQMMLGFARNAIKLDKDVNFVFVIAPISDFCDIKSYDELMKSDRVHFMPRPVPVNAFYGRIHFDVKWCEKNLTKKFMDTIDVIINNEPCLTRNIKTYLYMLGVNVPIVTQNFWMDCPTIKEEKVDPAISYDFRQIDGSLCSDLVPFTCNSTKEAFMLNCKNRLGTYDLIGSIDRKSTIWDMGFDADEFSKVKVEKFEKKTIVFPNRMSGINYTHHLEFIEAIKELSKWRNDFQVVFCNPSGKIEWSWLKENVPNIHIIKEGILSRSEYIELLLKSHVGVSLYTIERYGGCANVEMLYCGLKVIMPDVFEYKVRGGTSYPYYVPKTFDTTQLVSKLDLALNSKEDMPAVRQRVYDMSSYQNVSKIILKDLQSL